MDFLTQHLNRSGIAGTKMKRCEQKFAKHAKATAAGLLLIQNPGIYAVGANTPPLRSSRAFVQNSFLLQILAKNRLIPFASYSTTVTGGSLST